MVKNIFINIFIIWKYPNIFGTSYYIPSVLSLLFTCPVYLYCVQSGLHMRITVHQLFEYSCLSNMSSMKILYSNIYCMQDIESKVKRKIRQRTRKKSSSLVFSYFLALYTSISKFL